MLIRQFSPHGGLELYAHKVVEGLLDSGLSVTVVCQDKDSSLDHARLDYKFIESAPKSKSKKVRFAHLARAADEVLKNLDVELVHSQHCPASLIDVVTFHNHTTERLSKVGLWWEALVNDAKRAAVPAYVLRDQQDEVLCRNAKALIFPAEVMRKDYYEHFPFLNGPPVKPYVVAYPGASLQGPALEVSETDAPNGAGSAGFNFLFVGRGFRKKGLDVLLQACKILKEKEKIPFKLFIAGLKAKAPEHLRLKLMGLDNTVSYLGFQKDMESVYRKAKVTILPSRVEPFGMAPIQGMQRGLVPIVSEVSGVAEALHDEIDSLILKDQLSASELAELMQKLMNDPALLQRLSTSARASAAEITWEKTVEQTIKAYEIALTVKNSAKT